MIEFKECERVIGHCWELQQGFKNSEVCRHCGAARTKEWTQPLPRPAVLVAKEKSSGR